MGRRPKHKSNRLAKNSFRIRVFNRQKDLLIDKSSARALVRSTLEHLQVNCEEIAIYFVDVKTICKLHDQFFQDPTPTDCISFPLDGQDLGEIFVSPAAALKYPDPYEETSLYVVHGILHLLGYDDLDPKKKRIMRKKEKSCMGYLYEQKRFLAPQ